MTQVGQVVEIFPPRNDAGKSRDAVGAKLGMSGRTYEKVKTLYDYAKEGEVYEEWERAQARRRQEATRAQPGQQVPQQAR